MRLLVNLEYWVFRCSTTTRMAEEILDACHRAKKTEGKENWRKRSLQSIRNKTLKEMLKLKSMIYDKTGKLGIFPVKRREP